MALRWYVQAPDSGAAVALLAGDEPLVAPDLVVAEVTNAAWKLVRAGEISGEHGARTYKGLSLPSLDLFASRAPAALMRGAFGNLDHLLHGLRSGDLDRRNESCRSCGWAP